MEVAAGLTGDAALRERYHLEVEDRLPGIIADDLLADKSTPVATVLQIILTKKWETAVDDGSGVREFTIDNYQDLRKNGLAMKDFFRMQMAELARLNSDVVNSGLALDLLKFHATEMGTAKFRGIEEIRNSYNSYGDR
jgi:hypothetical protein